MKTTQWIAALSLLALSSSVLAQESADKKYAYLLGTAVPTQAAQRTIAITPNTKAVNVTGGETVQFTVGDSAFAWKFDVAMTVSSFELNAVAPAGLLAQTVRAYVATDPQYLNP